MKYIFQKCHSTFHKCLNRVYLTQTEHKS
uniref:Uncharacterized protein n=1 Tax=Anguilla anguilla TaxID=7936 RepID=A0A0E9R929_ANGAN